MNLWKTGDSVPVEQPTHTRLISAPSSPILDVLRGTFMSHNLEHKYYVYVYYDMEMNPYYIGKGCGTRITDCHGSVIVPEKKYRKKIKENLSEEESFVIESQLIRHFGRKVDGGILENIMPGVFDEEDVENFYHQKKLYDEWKEIGSIYNVTSRPEYNVQERDLFIDVNIKPKNLEEIVGRGLNFSVSLAVASKATAPHL